MEGMGDCDTNQVLQHHSSGSKIAKLAYKEENLRDFNLHAQAEATSTLAKVTLRKADCMEEQNLLFLMTTPDSHHLLPSEFLSCAGRRNLRNMKRGGQLQER